jgi:hypothetical protein
MKKHIIPSLVIAAAILAGGAIGRSTAQDGHPSGPGIPIQAPAMLAQQVETNNLLRHILAKMPTSPGVHP